MTREELIASYKRTFQDTADGETILDDLLARFYDADMKTHDPHTLAWMAGSREVVRYILNRLKPTTNNSES